MCVLPLKSGALWLGCCKVQLTGEKQGQVTKDEVTYPFSANSVFLNLARHSGAFWGMNSRTSLISSVLFGVFPLCVYVHSRMLEFPHYLVR